MVDDLKWELTILEVVHGFDLALLEQKLTEPPLLPSAVENASLHAPGADLANSLALMRRWLKLLDLAIAPEMLRQTLTSTPDQDLAEALLRYFASKRSESDDDRDKSDYLATFLYTHPRVPGQWELHGYSLDGVATVPPFEIALLEVLGEDSPELTAEHDRLLDEFQTMRDEVSGMKSFDELTDANTIARLRDLKKCLGTGFYHPRALAIVASFNSFFGQRFDELFHAAALELRTFAEQEEKDSGAGAKVLGNITVRNLIEIREEEILSLEYTEAQDRMRHVAHLKKIVEHRQAQIAKQNAAETAAKSATNVPASGYGATESAPMEAARRKAAAPIFSHSPMAEPAAQRRIVPAEEQSKLRTIEDSIRAFVRAANPKLRQIVPMKFGNLTLSPAEADAFLADLFNEKSFRADNAHVLVRIVSIIARVCSELAELQQRRNSTYLWKPHAESIELLIEWSHDVAAEAARVTEIAQQRGLIEKAQALGVSVQKMQDRLNEASAMLQMMSVSTEA